MCSSILTWISKVYIIMSNYIVCIVLKIPPSNFTFLKLSIQLNHLISENTDVTGSEGLSSLPDTCSPQSTPRLHQVCFQMKVRESDQLRHLVREDIYDRLSTYYPSYVANDETSCEWLQSSTAIPDDTRERIQDNIMLNCE